MNTIDTYEKYLRKMTLLINAANSYYVLDNPVMTDEEYDKLYHEVKSYEDKYPEHKLVSSPTTSIGGVSGAFKKSKHKDKMWSQNDIFTKDELIKWLAGIYSAYNSHDVVFNLECKYDGLSIKLSYENGMLIKAVTRGDGIVGEDVTNNARVVNGIPLEISFKEPIDINGEIVMHNSDFIINNENREEVGKELFANPRNAAAGSMRTLDSVEVSKRNLTFYPWGVDTTHITNFTSMNDRMEWLVELGFNKSPMTTTAKDIDSIMDFYNKMIKKRNKIDVGLDGLLIKVNDVRLHDKVGYTNKFPKWSCAFKFPAVEKTTTILDIVKQVGRTGVITPVAILDPVSIDGSVVSKATLHNFVEVHTKDIRIGDQVTIIKSGDIIPKIIKVFKERRTPDVVKYTPPSVCPNCGTKLTKERIFLKCTNPDCSSRLSKKLEFFGDRDHMNIDGLGKSVTEALIEHNLVRSPIDLYNLSYDKLSLIEGFKDKKINNLLSSIENSKGIALDKFIASLAIPTVGRTLSSELSSKFGLEVFNITKDDLLKMEGIQEVIADNFINFVTNNKSYIEKLLTIINPTIVIKNTDGKYSNLNVVLTGSMIGGKSVVKEKLENQGAIIKSSVSKDTDLVVFGDKAGSKLEKASKLGIKTISYEEV